MSKQSSSLFIKAILPITASIIITASFKLTSYFSEYLALNTYLQLLIQRGALIGIFLLFQFILKKNDGLSHKQFYNKESPFIFVAKCFVIMVLIFLILQILNNYNKTHDINLLYLCGNLFFFLTVGVSEELAFRGIILYLTSSNSKSAPNYCGVALSAILFSIEHKTYKSLDCLLITFLQGLLYCFVLLATNKKIYPILLHFFIDSLVYLSSFPNSNPNELINNINLTNSSKINTTSNIFSCALFFLFLTSLILLMINNNLKKQNKRELID